MTVRRPLLALAFALALAACPKPTDGDPQIAISPNVLARINRMPGNRGALVKSPAARAHVHPLRAGEELGGPNATGKAGDWVLENDEVVFVIDALGGGGGFAESGGNLIDAADARERKDELGQVFTYFGTFPRQAVYTAIDSGESASGAVSLRARGHELYDAALEVETEYQLGATDRALLVRTTLRNGGGVAVVLPALGDAVQWGGTEKVASGQVLGFKGRSSGPFIGGVGRFASYALTSTDGAIDAFSGSTWSDTAQQTNVTIAPGASITYARILAVGERADVASLVSELTKASGGDVGGVEITLTDGGGAPVRAPAGAKITVATPAGAEVMTLVAARDDATMGGELPPGRWVLSYAPSVGRRGIGQVVVDVQKDAVATATLAVTDAARLDASCREVDGAGTELVAQLPCKITLETLDGAAPPQLGPAHVAGPARNQLIAHSGDIALAPGKYRLTFTRGPEYEADVSEVTLLPATTAVARGALRRVVDTSGYVATDFHQHTILSADSPVSTRDRILGNAAEAVEVAIASEHNAVVDLSAVVRELALSRYVVSVTGNELTTDASKRPWGHANVFPLRVEARPRGGAPSVREREAKDVLDEVRAHVGPARVIQINHPRSPGNGYFDLLDFDPVTGVGRGAGYDAGFDAVEVWNGRDVDARTKVLADLLALLRTSHPVTAIADTDTHGIVGQEAGLPRTYVRVAKDDALDAWDAARTDELVRSVRETRDVVLTNGPFMRVTANGAGIGGVATARAGLVTVRVHVSATAFAAVNHAELRLAKGAAPVSAVLVPRRGPRGALEADATFMVRAAADDAFVVIVSGDKPMRPMFGGEDREITPWAMSGAIWIDADGDGKSLAREQRRR